MYRTEIENANQKLVIEVPEHVSGRRKNAYHCVFAEACNQLPNVDEAIIHLSTAYIRFKGQKTFTRYRVSLRLRDQIVMYDRFGAFDGGTYTLSVIQPTHRASGKRQGTEQKTFGQPASNRKRVMIKGVRAPAKISSL